MAFPELMERIIKARTDVLRAKRLLAGWNLRPGTGPEPNEVRLLVDLLHQADEALDSVVSTAVKESARRKPGKGVASRRSRRSSAYRSGPSPSPLSTDPGL